MVSDIRRTKPGNNKPNKSKISQGVAHLLLSFNNTGIKRDSFLVLFIVYEVVQVDDVIL